MKDFETERENFKEIESALLKQAEAINKIDEAASVFLDDKDRANLKETPTTNFNLATQGLEAQTQAYKLTTELINKNPSNSEHINIDLDNLQHQSKLMTFLAYKQHGIEGLGDNSDLQVFSHIINEQESYREKALEDERRKNRRGKALARIVGGGIPRRAALLPDPRDLVEVFTGETENYDKVMIAIPDIIRKFLGATFEQMGAATLDTRPRQQIQPKVWTMEEYRDCTEREINAIENQAKEQGKDLNQITELLIEKTKSCGPAHRNIMAEECIKKILHSEACTATTEEEALNQKANNIEKLLSSLKDKKVETTCTLEELQQKGKSVLEEIKAMHPSSTHEDRARITQRERHGLINASNFVASLGRQIGNKELERAGVVAGSSLVIAENVNQLKTGTFTLASLTSLANIGMAALNVFSLFLGSRGSASKTILKNLRIISKQIRDLHIDTLKGFHKLNQSIQDIFYLLNQQFISLQQKIDTLDMKLDHANIGITENGLMLHECFAASKTENILVTCNQAWRFIRGIILIDEKEHSDRMKVDNTAEEICRVIDRLKLNEELTGASISKMVKLDNSYLNMKTNIDILSGCNVNSSLEATHLLGLYYPLLKRANFLTLPIRHVRPINLVLWDKCITTYCRLRRAFNNALKKHDPSGALVAQAMGITSKQLKTLSLIENNDELYANIIQTINDLAIELYQSIQKGIDNLSKQFVTSHKLRQFISINPATKKPVYKPAKEISILDTAEKMSSELSGFPYGTEIKHYKASASMYPTHLLNTTDMTNETLVDEQNKINDTKHLIPSTYLLASALELGHMTIQLISNMKRGGRVITYGISSNFELQQGKNIKLAEPKIMEFSEGRRELVLKPGQSWHDKLIKLSKKNTKYISKKEDTLLTERLIEEKLVAYRAKVKTVYECFQLKHYTLIFYRTLLTNLLKITGTPSTVLRARFLHHHLSEHIEWVLKTELTQKNYQQFKLPYKPNPRSSNLLLRVIINKPFEEISRARQLIDNTYWELSDLRQKLAEEEPSEEEDLTVRQATSRHTRLVHAWNSSNIPRTIEIAKDILMNGYDKLELLSLLKGTLGAGKYTNRIRFIHLGSALNNEIRNFKKKGLPIAESLIGKASQALKRQRFYLLFKIAREKHYTELYSILLKHHINCIKSDQRAVLTEERAARMKGEARFLSSNHISRTLNLLTTQWEQPFGNNEQDIGYLDLETTLRLTPGYLSCGKIAQDKKLRESLARLFGIIKRSPTKERPNKEINKLISELINDGKNAAADYIDQSRDLLLGYIDYKGATLQAIKRSGRKTRSILIQEKSTNSKRPCPAGQVEIPAPKQSRLETETSSPEVETVTSRP